MNTKREQIGTVGVDSGCIWVGDPCYIIHSETYTSSSYVGEFGKDWGEFCNKMFKSDSEHGTYKTKLGIVIPTLYGDGSYPVFVEYGDNGRPSKVIIDFDPQDDETEEDLW